MTTTGPDRRDDGARRVRGQFLAWLLLVALTVISLAQVNELRQRNDALLGEQARLVCKRQERVLNEVHRPTTDALEALALEASPPSSSALLDKIDLAQSVIDRELERLRCR